MRNSVEFGEWSKHGARICGIRGSVLARLACKESWILLPLRGNKRLRGSLSALLWVYWLRSFAAIEALEDPLSHASKSLGLDSSPYK